ncbi:MAG: hypothetical protein AAB517_02885 [Patescibacteria group bacterium]
MGKKITLELDADVVVQITENHGGYEAGKCLACGTHGWLCESRYGFPYGSKKGMANEVHHKPHCPMNTHLNDDGSLKE